MLSFSASITKELNSMSLIGDKPASDIAIGDMSAESIVGEEIGTGKHGLGILGTKKTLFKDILLDIAKDIATKQSGENTTSQVEMADTSVIQNMEGLADNSLILQELAVSDAVTESSEINTITHHNTGKRKQPVAAFLQDKVIVCNAADKGVKIAVSAININEIPTTTANEDIKQFAQKFADNKIILKDHNLLENNIVADKTIVNIKVPDNFLNSATSLLNTEENIPAMLGKATQNSNDNDDAAPIKTVQGSKHNDAFMSIKTDVNHNIDSINNEVFVSVKTDIINAEKVESNIEAPNKNENQKQPEVQRIAGKEAAPKDEQNIVANTLQVSDLQTEYSETDAIIEPAIANVNIVDVAIMPDIVYANKNITEPIDNTQVSNESTTLQAEPINTHSVSQNIDNTATKINQSNNYVDSKKNNNVAPASTLNTTIIDSNVTMQSDVANAEKPSALYKPESLTDINNNDVKIDLNIEKNISNPLNINKIEDINIANNTPKSDTQSRIDTTINSNKIADVKAVLSKLLSTPVNSKTFGDQNIMLTFHKNPTNQLSEEITDALNIQSVEVSPAAIETKQVSNWVKTMPAQKVSYIPLNESYNLLENVVNDIVNKFYNSNIENDSKPLVINELPVIDGETSKPISLKFDSQTAAEYKISTSPVINEILAKIESKIPNSVALPKANNKPMLNSDNLFNIKEIPLVSSDSKLDIFIHENSWEVLFDINDSEEHIIFQSDFKNSEVFNNNKFNEVKLNIMGAPEELADVVNTAAKSYTVKDYKSALETVYDTNELSDIIGYNKAAVSTTTPEKNPIIKADNYLQTETENYVAPEPKITKNFEPKEVIPENVNKKDNSLKKIELADVDIDVKEVKIATPQNTQVIAQEKTIEDKTENKTIAKKANIIESNNNTTASFNALNINGLELVNEKTTPKPVGRTTKEKSKFGVNKTTTENDNIIPRIGMQNISLKSINNKEVSIDYVQQPVYNQIVSPNNDALPKENVNTEGLQSTQPLANKEDMPADNTAQQASNVRAMKVGDDMQPLISRTFINVKPQEAHRVIWHTADNMLKEGSKTATKSIKIVMNPQSLGDVVVEIKLQDNVANVSFKAKNIEALNEIEKNIGALKDMLTSTDIKTTEFKYERINSTNESSRNFGEPNQQQSNQQQSKNNQQQSRREFLNSMINDNDSINHDDVLQNNFYKLVEEYV